LICRMTDRINKVLAQLGYGSRRAIDALIRDGKVEVNGKKATLGLKVDDGDKITLNGQLVIRQAPEKIIIAIHKPIGVTTTRADVHAQTTIMDLLPPRFKHLYPIGRLDRDSRGLLLLTNDGDLAQRLQHPKFEHEKEYRVTVRPKKNRAVNQSLFRRDILRLGSQIISAQHQTLPPKVTTWRFNPGTSHGTVTLILTEGKKREIRNLFDILGYEVIDLLRTRIGALELDNLKEGEYRVVGSDSL
jgi:23S rRNA pseudouridine2605 synthase